MKNLTTFKAILNNEYDIKVEQKEGHDYIIVLTRN